MSASMGVGCLTAAYGGSQGSLHARRLKRCMPGCVHVYTALACQAGFTRVVIHTVLFRQVIFAASLTLAHTVWWACVWADGPPVNMPGRHSWSLKGRPYTCTVCMLSC